MIAEFSAGEWVFVTGSIVASITTAIVTVIVAIKTTKTHDAVNSRMSAFLAEQKVETAKILTMAIEKAHGEGVKQTLDIQKATTPAKESLRENPQQVTVVNTPSQPVPITELSDKTKKFPSPDDVA